MKSSVRIEDYGIAESEIVFHAQKHFSPERAVAAIHHHGVALIREALPSARMLEFQDVLKEWRKQSAQDVADGKMAAAEFEYRLMHGVDGPTLRPHLDRLLPLITQSVFLDCAQCYLGHTSAVVTPINHLLFRIKDEHVASLLMRDGDGYSFHQDHDLIPGVFPLNLWLPLSTVDAERTGLSFVFPYKETVQALPFNLQHYVAQNNGFIWTPEVEPGDMLLFHRTTIHGAFPEAKPLPRYSVEMRAGKSESAPDNYRQTLWAFVR